MTAPACTRTVRFGVNYTPRVGWFHHWLDFSADDVARDLDTIAELGVDHLRVFPLWPLLQPNRTLIRPRGLADVERVLELAADRGLDVCVDGLQGHLSSFDFVPAWLTSWHRRGMFTDTEAVASTATYLTALAKACAGHPNLLGLTVGNEVSQFTGTAHPEAYPASETDVTDWLQTMIGALRAGAPGTPVLHACYDTTWYDDTQPFTLGHVATLGDATVVHSWVFNGTAQTFGPDAFETRAHARYLIEVARAFQTDPDRPVWLQEVGAPRNVLPASSVLPFIEATLDQLVDTPELFGITWWCSHDVSRSLADFPELEYDLGLIDEHGTIKKEGLVVAAAMNELRRRRAAGATDAERSTLLLDPTELTRRDLAPGGAFWEHYMTIARDGRHPRVTLAATVEA
ncbi:MAG: cellulase family glycosylhydrolase [Micropruina sp.]|uniref:glycoside hydrolase 5 family protein n=1 Tax=Micropruina sp. TaxID=2737536 RepID=UPI0039E504F5